MSETPKKRLAGLAKLLIGCALLLASWPAAGGDAGYPLDLYLRQVAFEELELAPDGRHVAFVARTSEDAGFAWNVWQVELDEEGRASAPARLTSDDTSSAIAWSPDGGVLAFLAADGLALARGGEVTSLADPEAPPVFAFAWAPASDGLYLATPAPPAGPRSGPPPPPPGPRSRETTAPASRTAIYRLALDLSPDHPPRATGRELLAVVPARVGALRPSPAGDALAFVNFPSAAGRDPFLDAEVYLLPLGSDEASPRRLTDNALREGLVFAELGLAWDRAGTTLYFSAWGREDPASAAFTQWRIYRLEVDGGEPTRLAPDFPGAFQGLEVLGDGTLLTTAIVSTARNAYRLSPGGGRPRALSSFRGRVSLLSATPNGGRAAFVLEDHERFGEVYVAPGVDALAAARPVTSFHAELQALPRPRVETVRWPNGEGDEIEGVLLWPPDYSSNEPLPLIVDLHGGPWLARTETVGLPAPSAHVPPLLASRGYLVLTPNHRGSAGRGDAFLRAIQDRPCSRPARDVLAGVEAVVARGWADPERLGVMGHSWGATLVNCLVSRSDRFRAAATDAGLWNFTAAPGVARLPPDWGFLFSKPAPWRDPETAWQESPASGAGRLTTPTLITIGEKASTVPVSQSYELYHALAFAGVPARLLVFPHEGTLIARRVHQRAKVEAELAWFDYWLGR